MSAAAGLIAAGSVALAAGALGVGWPGRGNDADPRKAAVASDPYAPVIPGLCRSSAAARSGDVTGAERIFTDTLHGPLHDIARETAASDRGAAARLLEAKHAVEHGLQTASPDPAALGTNLDRLGQTTRAALVLTGHPAGHGC